MAALETRILVLGAVRLFEPVNGYQIRRELLSWEIETWAKVRPGSIYSMLSTLAKAGDVEQHGLLDGGRTVQVYTMTEQGREAFTALIRQAIREPQRDSHLPFNAAFPFLALIERPDVLADLRARREELQASASRSAKRAEDVDEQSPAPPQVMCLHALWERFVDCELAWLDEMIALVAGGGLRCAGDPPDWRPPADDPGWQMGADRQRYNKLLGRA